ncbi:MAG: hypothetical protein ACREBS_04530, partial [Nitrososphaerales archaeon]
PALLFRLLNDDDFKMKTHRFWIFITVFISLTVILGYASTVQMSQSQAESLVQSVQNIKPTQVGIFENNIRVALIEFIPIIGPAFGAISSYETGLVISATGQVPNARATGLESVIILLLTPIFWLEFFCYSLAVEESISIIISIKNKNLLTKEWKWILGSIVVVVAVLFVSAGIEVAMINFVR